MCVRDLWVKLNSVDRALAVFDRCDWTGGCFSERFEIVTYTADLITVTHPDLHFVRKSCKEIGVVCNVAVCAAVLMSWSTVNFAAKCLSDDLHAVADAEHWNSKIENRVVHF